MAQGLLPEVLIDRVILSGALPDQELPRADFMTKEDLPAIEDPIGTEHLFRGVMRIEATSEVTLGLGDSCPD